MTITEFLTARYDEEAASARAATPGPWAPSGKSVLDSDDTEFVEATRRDALHIARHDPARVLREIAAKRSVVDLHVCPCPADCGECGACSGDHHADPTPAPCETLRHMAAVHADHPDYQQEWAP